MDTFQEFLVKNKNQITKAFTSQGVKVESSFFK